MLVGGKGHSDLRLGQEASLLVEKQRQMLRSMGMVQQSLDLGKSRLGAKLEIC